MTNNSDAAMIKVYERELHAVWFDEYSFEAMDKLGPESSRELKRDQDNFTKTWQAACAHTREEVISFMNLVKSDWESMGDSESAHACGYLIDQIKKFSQSQPKG